MFKRLLWIVILGLFQTSLRASPVITKLVDDNVDSAAEVYIINLNFQNLQDNKVDKFNATISTLILVGFTPGSILFINSSTQIAQNNTQLFWDEANNRLGISTNAPAGIFTVGNGLFIVRNTSILVADSIIAPDPHHAFGVTNIVNHVGVRITSSFTSGGDNDFVAGMDVDPTLTGAAGDTNYQTHLNVAGFGITTQASETVAVVSAHRIAEPQITVGGGGTVNIAASLYIENAPTEGSVSNGAIVTNDGNVVLNLSSGDTFTEGYQNYSSTSTVTGWSSSTTEIFYKKLGHLVWVWFNITGTSDATTASFTLPFTASNTVDIYGCALTVDNGTTTTTGGLIQFIRNTSTVSIFQDMAAAAFTASGTKTTNGNLFYQTNE